MRRVNWAVPLAEAGDRAVFGGKASQLSMAIRHGLPVPPGFAFSYAAVQEAKRDSHSLRSDLEVIVETLGSAAVRSSAVDEDGETNSFAGQYDSFLNLTSVSEVEQAMIAAGRSAAAERIAAYRREKGLSGQPTRVGVIVQKMIPADTAGVLFTRNPVTGVDERVIEAAWGLGDAVVYGRLTPDFFRIARSGQVVERRAGHKPTAIRTVSGGGIRVRQLSDRDASSLCLRDAELRLLDGLASRCERVFGPDLDLEWAIYEQKTYLLQCRSITAIVSP